MRSFANKVPQIIINFPEYVVKFEALIKVAVSVYNIHIM